MKRILYTQTYHEVGGDGYSRPKFEAGKHYEVSDETKRHVVHGIAGEIDVPDEVPAAAVEAATAESAAEPVSKKSTKKA